MPKIQDITKLEFPSKVEFDLNEVEQPLRRKFRSENGVSVWLLILLGLAVLTFSLWFVGKIVDDQAKAEASSVKATNASLCAQYLNDTNLTGTSAQKTLQDICN